MRDEAIVGENLARILPQDNRYWFQIPHILRLNLILIIPLVSSAVAGFDGALMNGLQSTSSWKIRFGDPKGLILGTVNASLSIGTLASIPVAGFLSDHIGRRWTLLIGSLTVVVATIIQAAAINYGMFVAARCLVGIGSGLVTLPSPVIIAELAFPTHRGKYTGLFWTGFHLGAILAAWSTYGCQRGLGNSDWGWRVPSMVQMGLPLVQLAFFPLVPESPRWLIANGKTSEAREILGRYHCGGNVDAPLVAFEMAEIETAIRLEKQARDTKWSALVSTPGNRKRTAIAVSMGIFALWNGATVLSLYLTVVLDNIGIKSPDTQTLINGVITIFNLVVSTGAALSIDRLGRRILFFWSNLGMFVSFTVWTVFSAIVSTQGSSTAGIVVVVFIFVFSFHFDIAYIPLLFGYVTEIFPYSLRAKGITVQLICYYSSLIILSFVNPIALEMISWRYYIFFCCFLIIMVVVAWFLFPETRGHSLEEIAEIFDKTEHSSIGEEAILDGNTIIQDDSTKYKQRIGSDTAGAS